MNAGKICWDYIYVTVAAYILELGRLVWPALGSSIPTVIDEADQGLARLCSLLPHPVHSPDELVQVTLKFIAELVTDLYLQDLDHDSMSLHHEIVALEPIQTPTFLTFGLDLQAGVTRLLPCNDQPPESQTYTLQASQGDAHFNDPFKTKDFHPFPTGVFSKAVFMSLDLKSLRIEQPDKTVLTFKTFSGCQPQQLTCFIKAMPFLISLNGDVVCILSVGMQEKCSFITDIVSIYIKLLQTLIEQLEREKNTRLAQVPTMYECLENHRTFWYMADAFRRSILVQVELGWTDHQRVQLSLTYLIYQLAYKSFTSQQGLFDHGRFSMWLFSSFIAFLHSMQLYYRTADDAATPERL